MRASATIPVAVGVILAATIAANAYDGATTIHRHRAHARHAYAPFQTGRIAPRLTPAQDFFPHIAPYQPGQGDTDGLSRNPEDCNKGCIGGNPG